MMSHINRCILLLALSVGLSSSVLAAAACKPILSNLDEAIGVGQLGQSYKELPALQPTPDGSQCVGAGDNYYCNFSDSTGVEHSDYGKGLSSKQLFLPRAPTAPLPFGLTREDKLSAVIKKTEPYRKRDYRIKKEGLYVSYDSGMCYVNARGKKFSLNFSFDHEGYIWGIVVFSEDEPRSADS